MNVAVNSNATRMQSELTERAVHGSVKVDLYLSSKIIKEGGGREGGRGKEGEKMEDWDKKEKGENQRKERRQDEKRTERKVCRE